MNRSTRRLPVGLAVCALLLAGAGRAAAQSTTTTSRTTSTSTSTSTTLLPHPFSAGTAECLRTAHADFRSCRRGSSDLATCRTAFQATFPTCFADPAGVTCAKRCVGREATCLTSGPATRKTCRTACLTTHKADARACRLIADGDNLWAGGDASCLTTADANLDLCRFVCTEAQFDCRVTLKFCVANCANR
jgi:hypothetical protein